MCGPSIVYKTSIHIKPSSIIIVFNYKPSTLHLLSLVDFKCFNNAFTKANGNKLTH